MKTATNSQKNSGAACSADTTRPNCHGRNTWLAALSLALFSVLASPSAFGAAYYWDSDGNAAAGSPAQSTAGSGTWNAANTNWNLAGTAGSDVAWVSGSDAVFAGSDGTYAITLGSNLNIGNLTFSNSGYTVSASSALSLSNTVGNNTVTVAAGKTATIGNNVTFTNGFNNAVVSLTGDAAPGGSVGTLIIDNGGKVQTTFGSPIIYIGSTSNTAGTLRATTVQVNTGGTISSLASVVANGLLLVNGGSVSAAGAGIIAIGNFADINMPSSAILTINSGTATTGTGGLRFGTGTNTANTGGTLNLNGGTLTTTKIFAGGTSNSSTVNFNGGTLQASATNNTDFLSSSTINNTIVKAGGAVIDTNTFDVTISKALTHDAGLGGTADGGLTKTSLGTLTLSGSNTYTGATTISAGTLQIGNGVTTGSISSTSGVTDNATLAYDRSDSVTVGYSISGSGAVNQIGGGTTILTANNSYGSTLISSGALKVGAGGTTGTVGSGAVTDNASLVFNRSNAMTVANTISGSGSVTQAGSGVTTLIGNNSYSGTTTISSGTLKINGLQSGAGAYSVQNGATLGGSGSITTAGNAGITLAAGAKLSPGDGIGTLTADLGSGAFNISAGVTATSTQSLLFDLTTTAASDRVLLSNASSTFNIGSGVLEFDDFVFSTGAGFGAGTYTLFDSSHTITGTLGSSLTGVLSGLNATISFANSSQDIVLTVTAVPEPATCGALAGLALSGLSLTSVIRRRSKSVMA